MARGVGVASVCVKSVIITLPSKLLTGGGKFIFNILNIRRALYKRSFT
mgnify:CR=1 FL=1|jgi:hypothetical protein